VDGLSLGSGWRHHARRELGGRANRWGVHADGTRDADAMARWLAIFFAAGGTLSLASIVLPHDPLISEVPVAIVASSAYPSAVFLLLGRRFVGPALFHAFLGLGTVVVTLGVYFGNGGTASAGSAVFYLWSSLYASAFFSRRAALAHIGWIAACYATVLGAQGSPTAMSQWVLVTGTAIVTGLVVGGLADQIRRLARLDALTELPNRRVFEETLVAEARRTARRSGQLSVAIIDLDRFKHVNDAHGHQAGDRLLASVAAAWRDELRDFEMLARYGGDEFALLFPEAGRDGAFQALERLRRATPDVEFSAGIATWDRMEPLDRLMGRADDDLYAVKRARREAA
jgi:diguanylate cyclase (GGDEF)-like protein